MREVLFDTDFPKLSIAQIQKRNFLMQLSRDLNVSVFNHSALKQKKYRKVIVSGGF